MQRQSAPICLIRLVTIIILFWAIGPRFGVIKAEEPFLNHAGIVIQFGDGAVHKACVSLGADGEATGEEVLRASGVSAVIEYAGMGGTVCKIDSEGCSFPADLCFCQCTLRPGDPCAYWAYYHLTGEQWEYAPMGATSYTVRSGEVEGWAWGEGVPSSSGATPPVIPFDEICVPPSPTPSNTPLPTESPTPLPPTATWTATPVTPTATRRPPTATLVAAEAATPKPSETRAPTTTPTYTPPATATATGIPQPAPTFTLSPTDDPVAGQPVSRADTAVPTYSGTSTPVPSTTPLSDTSSMTPVEPVSPTPTPYSSFGINTRTPMPTVIPKQAIARAAMATKTPITAAHAVTSPPQTAATAAPSTMSAPVVPEDPQGGRGSSYLLFGVLAGGLAIFLIILRVRRSP